MKQICAVFVITLFCAGTAALCAQTGPSAAAAPAKDQPKAAEAASKTEAPKPASPDAKPPAANSAPSANAPAQPAPAKPVTEKPADTKKKPDAKADKKPAESPEEKQKRLEEFEHKADLKKAEWIEKTMRYGIQKDRKEAINFIPTVKDADKKKLLTGMLIETIDSDSDISILVKSLNIIAQMEVREAAPSIKKHLSNDSEDVRVAATYAIKDIKASELKADLIDKLKAQDFGKESNFTEAMLQTLADFKAAEIWEFAVEKIKDNKTARNLRLSLILFLGRSGSVGAKPYLEKTFSDPDEEMDLRAYSVNAIAKLDAKESLPAINKVLDEINAYPYSKKKEYNSLYLYCISALVRLGDQNAYPRLIESMKSDNPAARIRAIKLLKDLGDKRSIDILKYKSEYDPSPAVQKEAKAALKALGEKVDEPAPDAAKKAKAPAAKTDPKKEKDDAADEDTRQNKREDF